MTRSQSRLLFAALPVAAFLAGGPALAQAQDANTAARITKIESEVRALQRKVFPGTDGKYFTPEISAGTPTPTPGPPPASSAMSDMLVRVDALESQLARLTGQVEQNTNRIAQIEAKLAANAPPAVTAIDAASGTPTSSRPSSTPTPTPAALAPAKPSAPPSSSRVQAVSAVVKPSTGDVADDEYSYGYRLWEAKFYPEAQQQLKLFLEKYPRHARASWGRNLLGRAYLDDGNPLEGAKWFVQNYQADKRGERAPDSLLYLAVSMKEMKDTKRACIALAEFGTTYAAEAAGRLKGLYDTTRNGLKCP